MGTNFLVSASLLHDVHILHQPIWLRLLACVPHLFSLDNLISSIKLRIFIRIGDLVWAIIIIFSLLVFYYSLIGVWLILNFELFMEM